MSFNISVTSNKVCSPTQLIAAQINWRTREVSMLFLEAGMGHVWGQSQGADKFIHTIINYCQLFFNEKCLSVGQGSLTFSTDGYIIVLSLSVKPIELSLFRDEENHLQYDGCFNVSAFDSSNWSSLASNYRTISDVRIYSVILSIHLTVC